MKKKEIYQNIVESKEKKRSPEYIEAELEPELMEK
jgi:hypothetical protein